MTNELEKKISNLKEVEMKISLLEESKKELRNKIFEDLKENDLKTFKNEIATVSYVERKNIKFIKDKEEILKKLQDDKLVKYFSIIPEEIIPEHPEISKEFEKDIKSGIFNIEGIEIETKENPMIRFN